MKVDKRILGLAAVSLILSTLIMLTIARERIEKPVEILKNDYPTILEQNRKGTFSFAMVAREKFENLQLRFSILSQVNLKVPEMINPQKAYNATDSPKEVLDNVVKIRWLENETAYMGLEPERIEHRFQLGGRECKMLVYDYSVVLEYVSGRESILAAPLIYAGIIDDQGEAYFLAGTSDFFFTPQKNVVSLSVSHNAEEQNYLPDEQIWEGATRMPLSQAPQGGVLDYAGVGKDDTFSVIFTVEADAQNLPYGFPSLTSPKKLSITFMQAIRIYLDGRLYEEPMFNVMGAQR